MFTTKIFIGEFYTLFKELEDEKCVFINTLECHKINLMLF